MCLLSHFGLHLVAYISFMNIKHDGHMVQANIKENTQAPHYWFFASGIYRCSVDSPRKGAIMQRVSPWHDVIILYFIMARSLWTATVNVKGQSMDLDIIWHGLAFELLMTWAIFHIHSKGANTSLIVLIFTIMLSTHRDQNKMVNIM